MIIATDYNHGQVLIYDCPECDGGGKKVVALKAGLYRQTVDCEFCGGLGKIKVKIDDIKWGKK